MNWFSLMFPFVVIVSAVSGGVLVWMAAPQHLAGWLIEAGVMVLVIAAAEAGPAVGSGAGEGGGSVSMARVPR